VVCFCVRVCGVVRGCVMCICVYVFVCVCVCVYMFVCVVCICLCVRVRVVCVCVCVFAYTIGRVYVLVKLKASNGFKIQSGRSVSDTYFCQYEIVSRFCSWLRHCATRRKVAGSIPDGAIGIFH